MSVSLKKGQKVSLTKESNGGLNTVLVGLGWDEASKKKSGGFFSSLFSLSILLVIRSFSFKV